MLFLTKYKCQNLYWCIYTSSSVLVSMFQTALLTGFSTSDKKRSFKKKWDHIQIILTRIFAFTPSNISCFLLVLTADQFVLTGGPIHVSFPSRLTLEEVQRKNPLVVRGGRYRPPDCDARHKTAIIIPHRHREHHLKFLLYYLHPFLQRQQLQYGIYVIHQVKHAHKLTQAQVRWRVPSCVLLLNAHVGG